MVRTTERNQSKAISNGDEAYEEDSMIDVNIWQITTGLFDFFMLFHSCK